MPSQRRTHARRDRPVMAMESSVEQQTGSGPGRTVFVLGAGVDRPYGLPVVATLMRDLAAFADGEGAPIDAALRKKLPHLLFNFKRFAGDQSDEFLRQLFTGAGDIVPKLSSAVEKLKADPEMEAVGVSVERLCRMAQENVLTGSNVAGLARLAREAGPVADAELLVDPKRLTLSHMLGSALRNTFSRALVEGANFTPEERQVLQLFVEATSNFEELLSHYFTLYCTGRPPDQKTYLYLAWMLWAFLRARSSSRVQIERSLYARLPSLATDVITFNYTNFFDATTAKRTRFFHGRLDRYLRVDDRTVVTDSPALRAAIDVEHITEFVGTLRLDIRDDPALDIPAIVPPISFKPVMSREQLQTWAQADTVLAGAATVVIVGYSFAAADEHFNDLLRKGAAKARVIVVNPDTDGPLRAVCRILGIDHDTLRVVDRRGFQVASSGRLIFANATGEDIDADFLTALI